MNCMCFFWMGLVNLFVLGVCRCFVDGSLWIALNLMGVNWDTSRRS